MSVGEQKTLEHSHVEAKIELISRIFVEVMNHPFPSFL